MLVSLKEFEKLLVAYGNAMFDCGDDAGVDLDGYQELCDKACDAEQEVTQAFKHGGKKC